MKDLNILNYLFDVFIAFEAKVLEKVKAELKNLEFFVGDLVDISELEHVVIGFQHHQDINMDG